MLIRGSRVRVLIVNELFSRGLQISNLGVKLSVGVLTYLADIHFVEVVFFKVFIIIIKLVLFFTLINVFHVVIVGPLAEEIVILDITGLLLDGAFWLILSFVNK